MAVLRSAAMTWGMLPQRTCERSSSNVTSRTQCDLFSMCQWPRTSSSRRSGVARWGGQTGDPIDHFCPFLARFLGDDMTPQLKHLRSPWPIAVAPQGLTRGDIALLDAPMADVHRACGLLTIARRRERKDQLDIGPHRGLILL